MDAGLLMSSEFLITGYDEEQIKGRVISTRVIDEWKLSIRDTAAAYDPQYWSLYEISSMFFFAQKLSDFMHGMDFRKVLVIPSYDDANQIGMSYYNRREQTWLHRKNCSSHLYPLIQNFLPQSTQEVHVAVPDGANSKFFYLYENLGVNTITSNKYYTLGDDTFTVNTDITDFDCVILLGVEGDDTDLEHIQTVFSPYCIEGFHLVDDYQNRETFSVCAEHEQNTDIERFSTEAEDTNRINRLTKVLGNNVTNRDDGVSVHTNFIARDLDKYFRRVYQTHVDV